MSRFLVWCIKIYKAAVSPILPFNQCRFYPSCAEYAIESLEKHGTLAGIWLTVRRVARCHPLSKRSGFDPVP